MGTYSSLKMYLSAFWKTHSPLCVMLLPRTVTASRSPDSNQRPLQDDGSSQFDPPVSRNMKLLHAAMVNLNRVSWSLRMVQWRFSCHETFSKLVSIWPRSWWKIAEVSNWETRFKDTLTNAFDDLVSIGSFWAFRGFDSLIKEFKSNKYLKRRSNGQGARAEI